jgi:hypothetical protein
MIRPIGSRVTSSSAPAIVVTALAVVVAALAGGCGGSSHASVASVATPVGGPPPNIVGARQISAFPPGSPARSLLEIWQAVQFSDVEGARASVAPEALARISPARFSETVQAIGDNLPGLRVIDTKQLGAHASVRVYLLFYARDGSISATLPMAFAFHRTGGGYKLSDLSYFTRRAREISARQRRAPR